jgi:hypothetical protein
MPPATGLNLADLAAPGLPGVPINCQVSLDPNAPRLECGAARPATPAQPAQGTGVLENWTFTQTLTAAVGVMSLLAGGISIYKWASERKEAGKALAAGQTPAPSSTPVMAGH